LQWIAIGPPLAMESVCIEEPSEFLLMERQKDDPEGQNSMLNDEMLKEAKKNNLSGA